MRIKPFFIPVMLLMPLVFGCKNHSANGFETDSASGIQYQLLSHSDKGSKPSMGDYAEVMLTLKNSKDSIIFNSAHRAGLPDSVKTVRIHIKNSYKGCLAQGLMLMNVGDSACFLVSADSMYHKTFKADNLPYYVQAGSMLTCNVKLVAIETEEQAKAEREKRMQEREAMAAQRKADEPNTISKYLNDNHITVNPEKDGMYILKDEKGKGKAIKEGDSVEIQYNATLLDGTIVEESNHGSDRTTYFFSYKKEPQLPGIDDALANMKEGEKMTALFPSALAFGSQKQGMLIEPYTPLIFNITLVKVKPCTQK